MNLFPQNITSGFFNKLRRGHYFDGYKDCRDQYDYDFLFSDGDICLFEMWQNANDQIEKLFYIYLQSPLLVNSYDEYLTYLGLTYSDAGNDLLEEYAIEIDSIPQKKSCLKIHYDYHPNDYYELIHPASHIHISDMDDIRIPIKYILSPFEFMCFCLKLTKYDRWKNAIISSSFQQLVLSQRSYSITLDDSFCSNKDKYELYLSYN